PAEPTAPAVSPAELTAPPSSLCCPQPNRPIAAIAIIAKHLRMTSPFVGNRTALCNWRSAVRRAALRILQPLVERERHPPLTATTGYGVAPTAAIKAGFVLSTTNSRSIRRSPARQGH